MLDSAMSSSNDFERALRNLLPTTRFVPPLNEKSSSLAVSEPLLAWTMSGEVGFQERENKQRASPMQSPSILDDLRPAEYRRDARD
jgi:hypothetical protein